MKLRYLVLIVPAMLLASCANPGASPMQQAMAEGARAATASGMMAPAAAFGGRQTQNGMQKFFD